VDNSETGYLERWFSGNQESIEDYYHEISRKAIISPIFLRMEWKEKKLDDMRELLKHQKLERFLNLSGNTYPYLVKLFLTNMWFDDDVIYSQVKGVDMAINDEVWLVVAGLRNAGKIVGKGNTTDPDDFNKVQFFKTRLRNPNTAMKGYHVGDLALTPLILALIVIWLRTPRGYNHVLTEEA